nr:MAG TPA: protein of unknown function DUF641 [Caudoviricetes sp.]
MLQASHCPYDIYIIHHIFYLMRLFLSLTLFLNNYFMLEYLLL